MQRKAMERLIEDYLKKLELEKKPAKEVAYMRNLLLEKKNCFIKKWEKKPDYYWSAIMDTVRDDTGGKTETLNRMKDFAKYLKFRGVSFEIEWPPINDIGNRYERILYILRELQTADEKVKTDDAIASEYIAEKLWVNKRTIEEDFSYIRPPEDQSAPRTLFQQSLAINGFDRAGGAATFASTAHPFFLIENLRSVTVLIESLLEKAVNPAYREQAMVTARRIWKQLTDYARGRITEILQETYVEDSPEMRLFNKMKKVISKENAFIEERGEHGYKMSYLLDAMKFGSPCKVEYRKNEWDIGEWIGIIKGFDLQNRKLPKHGEYPEVPFKDILSVTLLESCS